MSIIVTIARQHGSGGRQIGQEVARLLKANYVDRQLISLAAERAGVAEEALAEWDERPVGRGERAIRLVTHSLVRGSAAAVYTDYPYLGGYVEVPPEGEQVDEKRYLNLISGVMKELAAAGSTVIVGRGASMLLKDMPNVLRVLVVAPMPARVRRVMERDQLSAEEAAREIARLDKNRRNFVRQLFKVEWIDPMNYDLVVNTGKYSPELAARLIADVAMDLQGQMSSSQG